MTDKTKAIGETFAEFLRASLSPSEWQTMRERNARQIDPCICHSHDFCDANEPMADAFRQVMGRDILPDDGEGMTQEDCDLWNSAWDYAKRKHLTTDRS